MVNPKFVMRLAQKQVGTSRRKYKRLALAYMGYTRLNIIEDAIYGGLQRLHCADRANLNHIVINKRYVLNMLYTKDGTGWNVGTAVRATFSSPRATAQAMGARNG